jgi:tryptophan synthase alpha chain
MNNRIERTFNVLRKTRRKALIPYIMAGDPNLRTTESLVYALEKAGADIIELGIPFSDPLADGPTIQRASERSLRRKTTLASVLRLVGKIRKRTEVPLVLMTYYNLIYRFGVEAFAERAARAGVDGVIIPDLPPEEAGEMASAARNRLATIFLLAPTSTSDRIQRISGAASGFVYYVSLTGITGSRLTGFPEIARKISEIRRHTPLPIGVGFGISSPAEAARISKWADGVIVGSALVRVIEQNRRNPVRAAGRFVASLRKAVG